MMPLRCVVASLMLGWVLGSGAAQARIGETLDQCRQRYGKATPVPTPYAFCAQAKALAYYQFERNGIMIRVGFLHGKASDLTFQHDTPPGDWSQAEIDTLLAANSSGLAWKPVIDGKLAFYQDGKVPTVRYGPYQVRDDGVIETVDAGYLHIFTPDWMAFIDAQMQAYSAGAITKQKKNLEGF